MDLNQLLEKVTQDDAPRWMVTRDGMDFGPYTARELVQQMLNGKTLSEHELLNMDTGARIRVDAHREFSAFAAQWAIKKKKADYQEALQEEEQVEKRSSTAKFVVAGLVGATVLAAVVVFLFTRQTTEEGGERAEGSLDGIGGDTDIEIQAGNDALTKAGGRGGRRGGGGGHTAPGTSYEAAMSQVVQLGDVSGAGGQSQLSPATVAGVMNQNINRLASCVGSGPGPGRVRVDIAIAGSGRVLGSSVRAGSQEFKNCVQSRVHGIHFPTFSSPRMGASYTFEVN